MKRELLNEYIGNRVRIEFTDNSAVEGNLEFTTEFCAAQGWKRPGLYHVGQIGFRCSHVKKLKLLQS